MQDQRLLGSIRTREGNLPGAQFIHFDVVHLGRPGPAGYAAYIEDDACIRIIKGGLKRSGPRKATLEAANRVAERCDKDTPLILLTRTNTALSIFQETFGDWPQAVLMIAPAIIVGGATRHAHVCAVRTAESTKSFQEELTYRTYDEYFKHDAADAKESEKDPEKDDDDIAKSFAIIANSLRHDRLTNPAVQTALNNLAQTLNHQMVDRYFRESVLPRIGALRSGSPSHETTR